MHVLLNEMKELAAQKKVPHRDFYNIRKVGPPPLGPALHPARPPLVDWPPVNPVAIPPLLHPRWTHTSMPRPA